MLRQLKNCSVCIVYCNIRNLNTTVFLCFFLHLISIRMLLLPNNSQRQKDWSLEDTIDLQTFNLCSFFSMGLRKFTSSLYHYLFRLELSSIQHRCYCRQEHKTALDVHSYSVIKYTLKTINICSKFNLEFVSSYQPVANSYHWSS